MVPASVQLRPRALRRRWKWRRALRASMMAAVFASEGSVPALGSKWNASMRRNATLESPLGCAILRVGEKCVGWGEGDV